MSFFLDMHQRCGVGHERMRVSPKDRANSEPRSVATRNEVEGDAQSDKMKDTQERKRKNAEMRKAEKKNSKTKNDVFNPDQDDNFFYIAGYTSGGAPFGVTWEEYERDIKEEQLMKQTINYNNKIFKPLTNTQNGETSEETTFHYKQEGSLLTATYSGGKIKCGHLIGIVDTFGNIDMRYHQINSNNELMTGICKSIPEVLPNGKLRLHETWQWTSGDHSKGTSIIEEV